MFESTDQLGRKFVFTTYPKRIISLVPSQTELLHFLNLENEVIGITKFCVYPNDWFKNKTKIGGTKNVNIEAVNALQPDLIIANKEENIKEQIDALQAIAPVWISDVNTLDDATEMITAIGYITTKSSEAALLNTQITTRFKNLLSIKNNLQITVCYLIWREPYMTVGGDTFIHSMLEICGFKNVFKNASRYPEITLQQLSAINCQIILLSSEPYPFKQKHIKEIQVALPNAKIILVDGEMFSWYGNRLLQAADYLKALRTTLLTT